LCDRLKTIFFVFTLSNVKGLTVFPATFFAIIFEKWPLLKLNCDPKHHIKKYIWPINFDDNECHQKNDKLHHTMEH